MSYLLFLTIFGVLAKFQKVTVHAECRLLESRQELDEDGHQICQEYALQNNTSIGLVIKSIFCTVNLADFADLSSVCYQWGIQVSPNTSQDSPLYFIYLLRITPRSVVLHYYENDFINTFGCTQQQLSVDNRSCHSAAMGSAFPPPHGEVDCCSNITIHPNFSDNSVLVNITDSDSLTTDNVSKVNFLHCPDQNFDGLSPQQTSSCIPRSAGITHTITTRIPTSDTPSIALVVSISAPLLALTLAMFTVTILVLLLIRKKRSARQRRMNGQQDETVYALPYEVRSQEIDTYTNVSYRPTNIISMAQMEREENDYSMPLPVDIHRLNSHHLDTGMPQTMNQENTDASNRGVDDDMSTECTYAVVDKSRKQRKEEQSMEAGPPVPPYNPMHMAENTASGEGGTAMASDMGDMQNESQHPNEWDVGTTYQNLDEAKSTEVAYAVIDRSKKKKTKEKMNSSTDDGNQGPPIPSYNPLQSVGSGFERSN